MEHVAKRVLMILAALAGITAVIWAVFRPPAIECIQLEKGLLQNAFSEVGEVIPVSEADIYTKTGGKLLEICVHEGDTVVQGEQIFVFDDSDIKHEQESILAEIAVLDSQITSRISALEIQKSSLESDGAGMKVKIEQASAEELQQMTNRESAKQLYEVGAVSAQDVTDAERGYELAAKNKALLVHQQTLLTEQWSKVKAEIEDLRGGQERENEKAQARQPELLALKDARRLQLDLLRDRRKEIEMTAPEGGIVRDCLWREGQIVPPGAKLCSVYQPESYRIDCYILVENTEGVNVGDMAEVTLRLRNEDRRMQGYVLSKSHSAADKVSRVGLSEKRIKVELGMKDEDWTGIGPYWPVEVRFVTAQAEQCLLVPKTALFEENDDVWKVWVVRDGKVGAVTVQRGLQTPSQAEIRGGLTSGDIIVKNAKVSKVMEGKSVRAVF